MPEIIHSQCRKICIRWIVSVSLGSCSCRASTPRHRPPIRWNHDRRLPPRPRRPGRRRASRRLRPPRRPRRHERARSTARSRRANPEFDAWTQAAWRGFHSEVLDEKQLAGVPCRSRLSPHPRRLRRLASRRGAGALAGRHRRILAGRAHGAGGDHAARLGDQLGLRRSHPHAGAASRARCSRASCAPPRR